ncbi:Uncharacterized protein HZ326_14487 [Fusarium oxysporum f. sp. albedinis]|nr:Uncharacterized protein HZ326_14487 [Fusarium oxysporum f. sp. albedinis]
MANACVKTSYFSRNGNAEPFFTLNTAGRFSNKTIDARHHLLFISFDQPILIEQRSLTHNVTPTPFYFFLNPRPRFFSLGPGTFQ